MTQPPIFLDTNVLIYAAGAPHPYKAPCVQILADVETGKLQAAINSEVLQELLYRYHRIDDAPKGIALCRDALLLPLAVLPVTAADLRYAIDLFETYRSDGLQPRDAVHAATMAHNNLSHILSADTHFDLLPFVTRIDPRSYLASPSS